MKLKIADLSILHRVYLGFAVLIGVLIAGSLFNFASQNQLNSALASVTSRATPMVLLASKLEVSLLSTNKHLTDVLAEKRPTQLAALTEDLEGSRAAFSQAMDSFKQESETLPSLQRFVPALENAGLGYLKDTQTLAAERAKLLQLLKETNKAKSQFQVNVPQFRQLQQEEIAEIEDDYVLTLFRSLQAKQAAMEVSTLDALNQDNPAPIQAALERNRKGIADYQKAIADLKMELPELENNLGPYFKSFINEVSGDKGLLNRYLQLVQLQVSLEQKARDASAEVVTVQEQLAQVQQMAQAVMHNSISEANKTLTTGRIQLIAGVALAITFAVIVAIGLARTIRRPLSELSSVLKAVTDGDMTRVIQYRSNNEFGVLSRQVNLLVEQMRDVLRQLAQAASQLNQTAHDNRTTTERSRSELEVQRHETASVAAAMTQMEASVREVAAAAHQTLEQVLAVEKASDAGRNIMATNISTTHQLATKLDETGTVIGQVNKMSGNIGNILDVIRGIAEQTNLLALNAAIEAARAGEHGRGFAVVADEVRTLARRTADSTAEIRAMIENLQQAVQKAVKVMNDCSNEMEASVQQSSHANSAMEEIQGIITLISDMSSQIASAAEQQQATSAEIAANLNRISEISDSNYEGIQEVAQASSALDELAERQQSLVQRFRI